MDQGQYLAVRRSRIASLLGDVRLARDAGKDVDEVALTRNNPDLMPDLEEELAKQRRVAAALAAASEPSASSAAGSSSEAGPLGATNPAESPEASSSRARRPAIQAPGYTIIRELGRGAQGVVLLATQLSTGRRVALKVMRDAPWTDDDAMPSRFRREVQILAALNHPNIVTIFDTGRTTDGRRYLTMNYIAGWSLTDFMTLRQGANADPATLLRVFLKICLGVSAAHARGIMHRDLKPNNIRIDERGEPHILDFGIARHETESPTVGGPESLSITGDFLGSLPWSSPEQAAGDPAGIDVRTDVYSLGVILYQMITGGRFPYEVVGNIRDVLNNILTVQPTPPSSMPQIPPPPLGAGAGADGPGRSADPLVNDAIEKIVLKALAKKPEDRYQTAGELARDIRNYLAGGPTAPRNPRNPRNTRNTRMLSDDAAEPSAGTAPIAPQRRRAVAAVVGTGVVLAAVTAGALLLPRGQAVRVDPREIDAYPIPDKAQPYHEHHYLFVPGDVDWDTAAQSCADAGGHLASAATFGRQAFLQQLKGAGVTAWVDGARSPAGEWACSDGSNVPGSRIQTAPGGNISAHLALQADGAIIAQGAGHVSGYLCEWDR